jgi:uncharacterized protein (TIGR03086 family)
VSEISDRYRTVAAGFTERARAVPSGGWDRQSPCEGWVARDIVRHLVAWMPGYFRLDMTGAPSVDDDPLGAWLALDEALQAAAETVDPITLEAFGIGDVLVHTWDLARSCGLDDALDADEVHRLLQSAVALDEVARSGHFGPRVEVPDDADEQTRLIALTGRHP